MRISTAQAQQQGINSILNQQAQLNKTQQQLATGQRILTPSDDPAGASRVLELTQAVSVNDQYQSNIDAARTRLNLEESTLNNVNSLLQNVRTLAVQANNSTLNNSDRASIALEIRQRLDELLSLANTKDESNGYLFAGYKGQTQPFARTAAGSYIYNGDQGQRFLQIGPTRQVAVDDSGTAVFQMIRNGNGAFTTLENTANAGNGIIDTGTVVSASAYQAHNFTILFTSSTTFDVINNTTSTTVLNAQPYSSGETISFNGIQTSVSGAPAGGDSFTVTPSANQDIFTTLQNMAVALEAPINSPAGKAQFNNAMNRTLTDIDQSVNNILATLSGIGARINAIDSQQDVNAAYTLQIKQTLSTVQDLDYAAAASQLNAQLLALQAAQQSFIKVQNLSLFNYLT
ncbi:MAG: flagellar hook-associated protein FlgL [Gammaproteobacteria bacterium]|nr:flagellar hook-associated protein FlgL [Gammaproteobacteria bacterium]